jgi:hypothetical protein
VLALTLTPALSPYRLAANSQSALALRTPAPAAGKDYYAGRGPIGYLRFDSGGYGIRRLQALAERPDAAGVHTAITIALEAKNPQELELAPWREALDALAIYPAGRTVEPALRVVIEERHRKAGDRWRHREWQPGKGSGLYIDLNGDGSEEFALVFPDGGELYGRTADGWRYAGSLGSFGRRVSPDSVAKAFAAASVGTAEQPWKDLLIGKLRLRVDEAADD